MDESEKGEVEETSQQEDSENKEENDTTTDAIKVEGII